MADLNSLVKEAQAGNKAALSGVVSSVQDQVYKLAARMLVNPDDALEATQEILILIITKLSTFKGESNFKTWSYRVSVNYLLTAQKIKNRDAGLTFDMFAQDLEMGLVVDPAPSAEDHVMLNELRIACTSAMLLCLDLHQRVAYVLGEILELDHAQAAEVLEISKENYRKRLSRARGAVVKFMQGHCGLVNASAKCHCKRRLPAAVVAGRVRKEQPMYAVDDAPSYAAVTHEVEQVLGDLKVLKLQTATSSLKNPKDMAETVTRLVQP